MPAYRLNPSETAALSLLLHLPIQPGSVLSIWLAGAELRAPGSLQRLVEQGYQSLASRNLPLEPALLQALTLLSVNAAHLTVVLRRSGRAAMSRFALLGRYALQYGIEGEHLVIHPLIEQQALAEKLLPAWFFVHKNENLQMEMPAGAFLLFKQACILADLTAAESNLSQSRFLRNRLWQQAQAASRSAARESQQAANPKQRLEQEYRFLLQERFLSEQAKTPESISVAIGAAGQPLAETLSDPDVCSLLFTLQLWDGGLQKTGAFLHGSERLFLLESRAEAGIFALRQLPHRQKAASWLKNVLATGGQARQPGDLIVPAA